MYRITFDGSVADEHGFVAMGGQADQVAAVLKERYSPGLSMEATLGAAIAALSSQGNGERSEINASQLEVAALVRGRPHRTFRRITGRPAGGTAGSSAGSKDGGGPRGRSTRRQQWRWRRRRGRTAAG